MVFANHEILSRGTFSGRTHKRGFDKRNSPNTANGVVQFQKHKSNHARKLQLSFKKMKIENLETAISFGEKRKRLVEFKQTLDDWFSSSTIKVVANTGSKTIEKEIHDDMFKAGVALLLENSIKELEDAIEKL